MGLSPLSLSLSGEFPCNIHTWCSPRMRSVFVGVRNKKELHSTHTTTNNTCSLRSAAWVALFAKAYHPSAPKSSNYATHHLIEAPNFPLLFYCAAKKWLTRRFWRLLHGVAEKPTNKKWHSKWDFLLFQLHLLIHTRTCERWRWTLKLNPHQQKSAFRIIIGRQWQWHTNTLLTTTQEGWCGGGMQTKQQQNSHQPPTKHTKINTNCSFPQFFVGQGDTCSNRRNLNMNENQQ